MLASVSGLGVRRSFAQEAPAEGQAQEPLIFSYDWLTETMRARAAESHVEPEVALPGPLADLSYDGHRAIRFFPDRALWKDAAPFELQAFHMGWLFKQPVRIFEVAEGQAREVKFTGRDFEYREPLDPAQFADVEMPGVAGFRLHYPLNRPDIKDELVAFLGASYFSTASAHAVSRSIPPPPMARSSRASRTSTSRGRRATAVRSRSMPPWRARASPAPTHFA
jgi:glucan biosynthesis protein